MMLDTDMIASPNYARLVYDGDGVDVRVRRLRACGLRHGRGGASSATGPSAGWPASRSRSTAARTTSASSTAASRRAACSPAPRRPKTAAQVAMYGGVAGRAARPVLPRGLRHLSTRSPASRRPTTMNTFATEPGARAAAGRQPQRQRAAVAGAVQGHARRTPSGTSRASRTRSRQQRRRPARRAKKAKQHRFKYQGHLRAHALTLEEPVNRGGGPRRAAPAAADKGRGPRFGSWIAHSPVPDQPPRATSSRRA